MYFDARIPEMQILEVNIVPKVLELKFFLENFQFLRNIQSILRFFMKY